MVQENRERVVRMWVGYVMPLDRYFICIKYNNETWRISVPFATAGEAAALIDLIMIAFLNCGFIERKEVNV